MLYVDIINRCNLYYISHDLLNYGDLDDEMCKILGISYIEYEDILKKFNATLINLTEIFDVHYKKPQYLFENKNDAENCAKYLEDVYITMQKLTGFDFGE